MKFILVTEFAEKHESGRPKLAYVPCVIFEPRPELEDELTGSSAKVQQWEMQGRVSRSRFEGASGERRYATEVIIDQSTVARSKE